MLGDATSLDDLLAHHGVDGYLIEAGNESADQGYLSGFWAPDPYATVYTDGAIHCLVKPLEVGRAREESRAESIANVADYGFFQRLEDQPRHAAWAGCIADFCADHGVDSVAVPSRFPHSVAVALGDADLGVVADPADTVSVVRSVKTEPELEAIAEVQSAAEAAMAAAEDLIADASVAEDGTLEVGGEALTSERVKATIERTLLDHQCSLADTIVAGGEQAADPHDRGSGPLHEDELIIIDIFPRHKETRYFGDLTRTFLRGEASEPQREWYDLTLEAQSTALAAIEAGTTGDAVHSAVCELYEQAGYATLRSDPSTETGFIHSTGHGVGLEIHEQPSLSQSGEPLVANHVVTVEPGLYDPTVGGVRIEDLVVVTEDGHHNLTEYPKRLRVA